MPLSVFSTRKIYISPFSPAWLYILKLTRLKEACWLAYYFSTMLIPSYRKNVLRKSVCVQPSIMNKGWIFCCVPHANNALEANKKFLPVNILPTWQGLGDGI